MSSSLTLANLRILMGSIDTTLMTDDAGNFFIAMALKEINNRYGYAASNTDLTTVTDQQGYDAPSGVNLRKIKEIIWHKASVSSVLANVAAETLVSGYDARMEGWGGVMQGLLDDAANTWSMARSRGSWRIVNQKIWLDPAPTITGDTILIFHDADYAAATNVPSDYDVRFWWIAQAWVLEMLSVKDAGLLEVQDGGQKIRLDGGKAMLSLAQKLRSRFLRGVH